jgi:hypothetical protein
MAIPRGERESASVLGLGVLGYMTKDPIIQSKEIPLEWDFVTAGQWDQMMELYLADQLVEWDPISPWVGTKHSVGDQYANPIPPYGQRFYHGLIGFLNYTTPIKKFDVGTYLSAWVPALGRYKYFIVTASGDFWADYEMEPGLTGNEWYQIQPGDTVQAQLSPTRKTKSIIGVEPFFTAAKYPDPAHTQRIYYHKVSGGDLIVGDNVYGLFSYLDYDVVALGPGYADVTALDPGYGTTAQLIATEAFYRWTGNFDAVVDYIGNLEIPEIDVEVTPRPDVPNYNVRIMSLTGELFDVAGYEQTHRENVKMKLLLRGVA